MVGLNYNNLMLLSFEKEGITGGHQVIQAGLIGGHDVFM